MTSQQFSPDLPDFTTENSAGIVNVESAFIPAGSSQPFGLSGVASYSILITQGGTEPVIVAFIAEPNGVISDFLNIVIFTAINDAVSGAGAYLLQLPSYGGVVLIDNQLAGSDITVLVMSTNRPVSAPYINQDYAPFPPYLQSGPFVAGVPQYLSSGGVGDSLYTSNVECGLTAVASGAGKLEYWFSDGAGTIWHQPIATLAANVPVTLNATFPFGIGSFNFTPTASDPAGTITLFAQPTRN